MTNTTDMTGLTRQASRLLFSVAIEQGGYFTAKQARQAGYGYPHLDYNARHGEENEAEVKSGVF